MNASSNIGKFVVIGLATLSLAARTGPRGTAKLAPSHVFVTVLGPNGLGPALVVWLRNRSEGWIYDPPGASPLAVTTGPGNQLAFSSSSVWRLHFAGKLAPGGPLIGRLWSPDRHFWGRSFGLESAGPEITWARPDIGRHCAIQPGRYNDLKFVPRASEWLGTEVLVFGCDRGIIGVLTRFLGEADFSDPLYLIRNTATSSSVQDINLAAIDSGAHVYSKQTIELRRVPSGSSWCTARERRKVRRRSLGAVQSPRRHQGARSPTKPLPHTG